MIDFLIRVGPLGVGVIAALMAWNSWTFGEPPPWSVFGPKSAETVLESRVEEGRAGNGTTRYTPVVVVTAEGEPQQLDGLVPSFSSFSVDMATHAISGYPVGGEVQVRWVGGKAMADRTDLFGMAHAIFISVFAAVFLFGGLFWAWAMGRNPKAQG